MESRSNAAAAFRFLVRSKSNCLCVCVCDHENSSGRGECQHLVFWRRLVIIDAVDSEKKNFHPPISCAVELYWLLILARTWMLEIESATEGERIYLWVSQANTSDEIILTDHCVYLSAGWRDNHTTFSPSLRQRRRRHTNEVLASGDRGKKVSGSKMLGALKARESVIFWLRPMQPATDGRQEANQPASQPDGMKI